MRDRDVLRSYDFGRYIGKLKVNLFFVGILLILGMLLFPLQVQVRRRKGQIPVWTGNWIQVWRKKQILM